MSNGDGVRYILLHKLLGSKYILFDLPSIRKNLRNIQIVIFVYLIAERMSLTMA